MKRAYKPLPIACLVMISVLQAAEPGLREGKEPSTTIEPVDTSAKSQEEAQREAAEKAASQAQATEADQPPADSTERSDQEVLEGFGEKVSTIPSLPTETAKQGEEEKISVSNSSAWSSILNALSAVKSTIQSAISSFVRNVLGIRSVSPKVKAAALDLSTQVKELGADVAGFSENLEKASAGKPTSWQVIEAEFKRLNEPVNRIVEAVNKLPELREATNPADQKAIDLVRDEAIEVLAALRARVYSSSGSIIPYRRLTPEEALKEEEARERVQLLEDHYSELIGTLSKK